jgi:LPXTG-motif cell wall-anchored protein
MGELGALSSNAMLGLGAVLLGTVGYFVWRKKKK